jgi:hypothetical protein
MVPCDLFLFPQIENSLKGKEFEDVEMIRLNIMQQLVYRSLNLSLRGASSSGRATRVRVSQQRGPF